MALAANPPMNSILTPPMTARQRAPINLQSVTLF